VTIREIRIAEHFADALPMMRENWRETGFDFEFNPSLEIYQRAQDAGVLLALGAFEGEVLIGYATAAVTPHPFNPEVVVCATDSLYVQPQHRKGTTPGRLMLELERVGKQRGARFVLWHTRAGTALAQTLRKRGYIEADTVVMKEL